MRKSITKIVLAGTLMVSTTSIVLFGTGCSPVTVVTVAIVTVEQLIKLIAMAVVSVVVYEVGEAVYVELRDAITGETRKYEVRLQPGEVLEVHSDGTSLIR